MVQAFVGRTIQRRQLIDWLAAAADGRPVTVLIDGDAGVGKTSVIEWFAAEATRRRALVLSGACIELGGGSIPYGALTEALRLFVREVGLERAQRLAGRSWSALGGLISDLGGQPPTAALDPQPRILGAMLRLPDHIGRLAPLVLILEDVHWADPSTLDLLRYLTKAKTDQKLMLVCSFRTVAARHPLQALLGEPDFNRRVHRISLGPFTRPEHDEFVTGLTQRTVPSDRLARYFELSEGNAYFAEQLVTSDDPRNPDVEVPQSLRALMVARLNRLSDEAIDVTQIAAVARHRLGDDLLAAVSELDERALEDALGECVQQRILVADSTNDAYAFEHSLLRDTAYQQILPRSRKRLHARMAEALSNMPGARTGLVPELAYHWFEAGRLPEAFGAAMATAGRAVRLGAFPEAQAQYERALRLWPEVGDAPVLAQESKERLLGRAADAARWAGHVPRAVDWVREAIAEVDATSDPDRAGELHERWGSYLWEAEQHDESAAAYAEADRLLAGRPPSAVASRVQAALATVAIRGGDYPAGLKRARRAVELAAAVGARTEEGRALNSVGLALTFQGQAAEAERALRDALAIAAEVDHLEDLFRAYGNLGVCLEDAGRLPDAVAAMTDGLAKAKEHGLLRTRQGGVLANNAAAALSLLGRYEEAASLLDSVLLDRPVAESLYARLTRAEIYVAQGNLADAERLLEEIRRRPNSDPRFVGPFYGCLADVAAWQGRLDEARSVVERGAEAIAAARNPRVIVQLCAVGLRVAADLQDLADAPHGEVLDWADRLMATQRSAVGDPATLDEVGLLARLCRAERARASREDTAEMWAELAAGWDAVEQPYRKAYALARRAAAAARSGDRPLANLAVRDAHAIAETIGARPLRHLIETLAHRLRLRLGKPRPYGLTVKELEILRELAPGKTNNEIAETLFLAPSTVSVHVSAILRKMEVRNRVEAADRARREGLVAD